LFGFAFPNYQNRPPVVLQLQESSLIMLDIPTKFILPKGHISFGHTGTRATGMPVPKTTMDEYDLFPLIENQIRRAHQSTIVDPKTIPVGME